MPIHWCMFTFSALLQEVEKKKKKKLLWVFHHVLSYCLPSGRAIKHVKESIFTPEAGARRGIPRVLVVLTDGRSQDDVNKVSKEMQMDGGHLF